ncbi:MAG: hypothetical protein EP329_06880 [Deltaproteobacteria bacterium]|nr:MAG: hypothetical protein EP329_06880 [Deltaproteobacteria bacterium]
MRYLDITRKREVSRRVVIEELRRQGLRRPEDALRRLEVGDAIGPFKALADRPPSVREITELTGASYAAAYRWTTGRARFPLQEFLQVVVARGADTKTAIAWAERWLRTEILEPEPEARSAEA